MKLLMKLLMKLPKITAVSAKIGRAVVTNTANVFLNVAQSGGIVEPVLR
jgi:hypothetical protein